MKPFRLSPAEIINKAVSQEAIPEDNIGIIDPDLEVGLEDHKLQYEIDALRQELKESADNHQLRIDYANKIFILVCVWLGCVIAAVLLAGFKSYDNFTLSDKVLITFITSTTINVLGLFAIVAKWLFQQNNKDQKKDKSPKK